MRSGTIIAFSMSLLFALLAAGGSWYMLSRISSMETSLSEAQLELKKEEARQTMILEVKRNLNRLEAERNELGQYFFKEEDIVELIEQLENLARHAQVDLDVTTASGATDKNKQLFRVGTKISGSWQNSLYFLLLIESLPLRIDITRVGVAGGENSDR